MPDPVPTRAGKVFRFAATRSPPAPPLPFKAGLLKSKMKFLLSGRSVKRSAATSASESCAVRERAGGAVRLCLGAARTEVAKMAETIADVKSMIKIDWLK